MRGIRKECHDRTLSPIPQHDAIRLEGDRHREKGAELLVTGPPREKGVQEQPRFPIRAIGHRGMSRTGPVGRGAEQRPVHLAVRPQRGVRDGHLEGDRDLR